MKWMQVARLPNSLDKRVGEPDQVQVASSSNLWQVEFPSTFSINTMMVIIIIFIIGIVIIIIV